MSASNTQCKRHAENDPEGLLNPGQLREIMLMPLTLNRCQVHPFAMSDNVTLSERVAEEIRAMLGRQRMSGRQLANKLGVSQSWMSTRLAGTTPIDLNDLERIAAILHVDIFELMPHREGRLITVGGTSRPTRGDLTTAISPLTERRDAHGPRSRVPAPVTARTGRIHPDLIAA